MCLYVRAEKHTWREFGVCGGRKTPEQQALQLLSSGTAFLSIPTDCVRLCAHASACVWFSVQIVRSRLNRACPGLYCWFITPGTVGAHSRQPQFNCCLPAAPPKTLCVSVNHSGAVGEKSRISEQEWRPTGRQMDVQKGSWKSPAERVLPTVHNNRLAAHNEEKLVQIISWELQ